MDSKSWLGGKVGEGGSSPGFKRGNRIAILATDNSDSTSSRRSVANFVFMLAFLIKRLVVDRYCKQKRSSTTLQKLLLTLQESQEQAKGGTGI